MNLTSSSRTWQFNDNFTWTKLNHTMKFGADIRMLHAAPPTTNQGADNYGNFAFNGMFTGNQFADYDLGLPNTSEVDDLPLMHPDHGVCTSPYQQSQMGERAKTPVSHQNIPELEDRVKELDMSHLVSSQRSG